MKALVLAGGAGTRLRPITHTRAKQLVPVANKPILFYGIESMVAAGITEIGVLVGDTRAEVMAGLGDGSKFGAQITYIPQDAPLGLAHCVLIAHDFLGDDDFVMYLGDNLLEQDLAAFVAAFESARRNERQPSAQILLKRVPDPHRFDVTRANAGEHTSFGFGAHHCLGAPLARLEAEVVFRRLIERAPTLSLPEQPIQRVPNMVVRGLMSLRVGLA